MTDDAAEPSTVNMHASSFPYNLNDKRAVAGSAQVILVGRVLAQVGSTPLIAGRARSPRTQYSVQVITSLKGDRAGQITVNQMGGRKADGTLYLFENDPLLEVGATYLLAGSYSATNRWYSLIPRAGTRKLGTDLDAARAAIGANPLVTEWREAVASPKPPKVTRQRDALPPPGAEGAPRLSSAPPEPSSTAPAPSETTATSTTAPPTPESTPPTSPPPST